MADKIRVALIGTEFHQEIMDVMMRAAGEEAVTHGGEVTVNVSVPGSYEVPLIAEAVLKRADVDVVVVLGYIERGETLHGEVMGHVVHASIVAQSIKYGKPLGVGIIGPGATVEQAEKRKDGYARAAVRAALKSFAALQSASNL